MNRDDPRPAHDLICGIESPSEQEYGDRMDALEAEERLSRHSDFLNFTEPRLLSSQCGRGDNGGAPAGSPSAGRAGACAPRVGPQLDAKQAA